MPPAGSVHFQHTFLQYERPANGKFPLRSRTFFVNVWQQMGVRMNGGPLPLGHFFTVKAAHSPVSTKEVP